MFLGARGFLKGVFLLLIQSYQGVGCSEQNLLLWVFSFIFLVSNASHYVYLQFNLTQNTAVK